MKKVLSLIIVFALLITLPVLVFAEGEHPPILVDEAGLLTQSEFDSLNEKLNTLSTTLSFDIVVVTVNDIDGKTPMEYSDDYYDYNGYGYGEDHDGCLLLISMAERDWWITTTGYGITAITDYGIRYIEDTIVSYLSSGDYYGAFSAYADTVESFVKEARNGKPYDIDNTIDDYYDSYDYNYDDSPRELTAKDKAQAVIGSIVLALVISLVVSFGIKRSYTKAVHFNRDARNYLVPGSLNMSASYDNFLYSNVTKVRIQSESSSSGGGGSSTHVSSSGTSHGGGGGKF
ncbi:MAG: TPM domain-containing protein [Clostridia bacterium]|nr:TPM domain-containing protein [Clostridia bacterium]